MTIILDNRDLRSIGSEWKQIHTLKLTDFNISVDIINRAHEIYYSQGFERQYFKTKYDK